MAKISKLELSVNGMRHRPKWKKSHSGFQNGIQGIGKGVISQCLDLMDMLNSIKMYPTGQSCVCAVYEGWFAKGI